MRPSLGVDVVRGEQHDVVQVEGELDLSTTTIFSRGVADYLVDVAAARGRPVVVDLTLTTFLTSIGLASILLLRRRILASGGTVELAVCEDSRVHKLLEMTHIIGAIPTRVIPEGLTLTAG